MRLNLAELDLRRNLVCVAIHPLVCTVRGRAIEDIPQVPRPSRVQDPHLHSARRISALVIFVEPEDLTQVHQASHAQADDDATGPAALVTQWPHLPLPRACQVCVAGDRHELVRDKVASEERGQDAGGAEGIGFEGDEEDDGRRLGVEGAAKVVVGEENQAAGKEHGSAEAMRLECQPSRQDCRGCKSLRATGGAHGHSRVRHCKGNGSKDERCRGLSWCKIAARMERATMDDALDRV